MKEKILAYLRPLIFRTFDIREGEFVRARLMLLQIFLLIGSLLVIKPAVNALFLANFGARQLPVAFIMVALSAAIVSIGYSRLLHRYPLNKIILKTIWFSVISFIVFGTLLRLNFLVGWVLYLFYLWVSIFAVLSASQFWILANVVFNSREAKRLFGFIGAGAIAGGIFGGYLATLLASLIGSENLVFGGALLLAMSIPVTRKIWKNHVAPNQTQVEAKITVQGFGDNPLKLILGSRHLTFLALIIAVSVVVAKLVEYQYSAIASMRIKDPDDLTVFFGFWFSNFNVLSLLIQLFLTRRVVGVYGVGMSLLFLPLSIMVGAVVLMFFPELWAAILIKLADGSMKQSINKSAIELLALPIPAEIKKHTKSFIDVFVDLAATGAGGLILLFIVTGLNLSTGFVSLIIFLLVILWIYLARHVRREYLIQFKSKITEFQSVHQQSLDDLEHQSILGGIREVFANGNDDQILYMLKKVNEIRDERLIEDIFQLMTHPSTKVRLEALRNLYFLNSKNYAEELRSLTTDPDEQIRIATFEYLAEHLTVERIEEFTTFLDHPDSEIRQSALIALATESKGNAELQKRLGILEILREKRKKAEVDTIPEKTIKTQKVILRAIGAGQIVALYDYILSNLQSPRKALVLTSIESAGYTLDPIFIKPLFQVMEDETFRESGLSALSRYGIILFEHLPNGEDAFREWGAHLSQIPVVIEMVDAQKSVDYLFELLDYYDGTGDKQVLDSLNVLTSKFNHLQFHEKRVKVKIQEAAIRFHERAEFLHDQGWQNSDQSKIAGQPDLLLKEPGIREQLERVFRLLGLLYHPDDMLGVLNAITSTVAETRINAIEFLDTLLEPGIKRILIPIVEAAVSEVITQETLRSLDLKRMENRFLFR